VKADKGSPNQGCILLRQRSQEPKAIANRRPVLLSALKQPHKGNKLNCSRKHIVVDTHGLWVVRGRKSSGEGNYGVNAEKPTKRGDQGKRREPSACFVLKGQNSSLRITTVSANNKVLYNTNTNRKELIIVYQSTRCRSSKGFAIHSHIQKCTTNWQTCHLACCHARHKNYTGHCMVLAGWCTGSSRKTSEEQQKFNLFICGLRIGQNCHIRVKKFP